MKGKKINIIPVVILIALAIFIYVNNKNSNKDSANVPSATVTATTSAAPTPAPASSPSGTGIPSGTPSVAAPAENYKTEAVKDFNITVNIPEQWVKKPQYDNRYEGSTGFTEFTALSGYGLSLKEAADLQISNEQKPLGDSPKITNITVDSQEAAVITPSGSDPKAQCAILVKFPKSITISGTPYYYLLVWSDREHAGKISENIKFEK